MRVNEQLTQRDMQEKMMKQAAEMIGKWREVWVARGGRLTCGGVRQLQGRWRVRNVQRVKHSDDLANPLIPVPHRWDEVRHCRAKSIHPSNLSQLQEVLISTSSAGRYMSPAESRSRHVAAAIGAKGARCRTEVSFVLGTELIAQWCSQDLMCYYSRSHSSEEHVLYMREQSHLRERTRNI